MPLSDSEARSHSVLETSLTELAFIFFFILAIFASWKINDTTEQLVKKDKINNLLNNQVAVLTDSLLEASKFAALGDKYDPAVLFDELKKGNEAVINLKKAEEKQKQLEEDLDKYTSLIDQNPTLDIETMSEKIQEFDKIEKILDDSSSEIAKSISDKVKQLQNSANNIIGQNTNLRNKLASLGSGVDHPPCWANKKTGNIEYLFDVIINENSIVVNKGWPKTRNQQAIKDINITKVIGEYSTNSLFWDSGLSLFEESKINQCRHFVRVYDHSESKKAFKLYLSGIENYFYKYLSTSTYE